MRNITFDKHKLWHMFHLHVAQEICAWFKQNYKSHAITRCKIRIYVISTKLHMNCSTHICVCFEGSVPRICHFLLNCKQHIWADWPYLTGAGSESWGQGERLGPTSWWHHDVETLSALLMEYPHTQVAIRKKGLGALMFSSQLAWNKKTVETVDDFRHHNADMMRVL